MTQGEVRCKGRHKVIRQDNMVLAHGAVLSRKEQPASRSLEPKVQYAIVIFPIFDVKRNTKIGINSVGDV